MNRTRLSRLVVGVLAGLACGCGGPVVTVRHTLPSDLPVLLGRQKMNVGRFQLVSGPKGDYGRTVAELLGEKVSVFCADGGPAHPEVNGRIRITTFDKPGSRSIRRGNPARSPLEPVDVDTLVRSVDVRVEFLVTFGRENRRIATVETRERYNSLADARVRGELALGRADDPAAVPSVETIVKELLARCVDTFARMVTPPEVVAEVPLRGTLDIRGRQSLAAAREEDYEGALAHAAAAARLHPKDANLLFNLGVLQEKSGQLAGALAAFQAVSDRTSGRDKQAAAAITRIKRILARRGQTAETPPAE